jgi:hypothetical protein
LPDPSLPHQAIKFFYVFALCILKSVIFPSEPVNPFWAGGPCRRARIGEPPESPEQASFTSFFLLLAHPEGMLFASDFVDQWENFPNNN